MTDNRLTIEVFVLLGGIITTYLAATLKNKQESKKIEAQSDTKRLDVIMAGYEKLINAQQEEIEHKKIVIVGLEDLLEKMQVQLNKMRDDLHNALEFSTKVQRQLSDLKDKYGINDKGK